MADAIVLSYHDTLLRQSDVRLLDLPNWLNDRVISFCFQYYEQELFRDADFAFISPDVAQFIKLSPEEELEIFLSPLKLNRREIIFVPVNDNCSASQAGGQHWSLLTYCKKSNEFYHYDSSGSFNRTSAMLMAKKLARHMGIEVNLSYTNSPQQQNGHDCGLYVICNTEQICRQATGVSQQPLSQVVTAESVNRKRVELKKLISELGRK